jgi:hypothetical protein
MNAGPIYVSLLRKYCLHCLTTGSRGVAVLVSTAAFTIGGATALNDHGDRDSHREVACRSEMILQSQGPDPSSVTTGQTQSTLGIATAGVYVFCTHGDGD